MADGKEVIWLKKNDYLNIKETNNKEYASDTIVQNNK